MGVRALRARIECDRQTLWHLWRTHCVFNERLPTAINWLFKMRRGECGADDKARALYKEVAEFIIAAPAKSNFDYLMNSVSLSGRAWKAASAKKIKVKRERNGEKEEITGDAWAERALALQCSGILLYDKREVYGDLPLSITAVVIRDAAAAMSSHDALTKLWEREHVEWAQRKVDWESEHPEYMRVRDRFAAGEAERRGRFGKRAERDHAYLAWLEQNPDLAAWRGRSEPKVTPLDDAAKARIAKAKPWKRAARQAEEFWSRNPELHALHRLHVEYEREFARRRRTRRNKWREGFKQRPTFTMPDPIVHPRWAQFNAPQTSPEGYHALNPPASPKEHGSLKLRLLTGPREDGRYPNDWVEVRFRPDPRLAALRRVQTIRTITKGKKVGEEVASEAFRFRDDQLGIDRDAKVSGVRLIFRNIRLEPDASKRIVDRLISATAYLMFTVDIKDEPRTERAKAIAFDDTGELTKSGKKRKKKTLPDGLVSVAVDLDARGIGFLTRAVSGLPESEWTHDGVKVIQSRNLVVGELQPTGDGEAEWSPGPTLEHIRDHKRDIARSRRLRGKPVKGERSSVRLQDHITNMGEDRFKKAARKIVNDAFRGFNRRTRETHPRADVLLMEDMKWFNPDATRERGINRMLARWNRANLMKFIERFAKDAGIRFGKAEQVSAWGTSQVCSKCGALGRRYRIERDPETRQPAIRFARGNEPLPLFACPNADCRGRSKDHLKRPFTCNSDHNASINLHRRYVLGDAATVAFSSLTKDEDARRREFERIEEVLRPALAHLHRLDTPLATPW